MDIENQEVETVENPEVEIQSEAPEVTSEVPEVPAYEPNFKFRVDDKEFEFDERIKSAGLIKSKEDEEYFRDLYTKAHGLDLVKARQEEKEKKWQAKESEFSTLRSQHERVQNSIQKLVALKGEDFTLFQKAMDIPDDAILKRASQILKVHGNPEAEAEANRAIQSRLDLLQYQDRVNQESQTQSIMQRQLHEMKMTQAMGDPEISKFAAEYDRRVGEPGAFVEEVNRLGTLEFHQGRYLDPQVAVAQARQRLSKLIGPLQEAHASAPTPQQKAAEPAPRPTLPNMGSGRTGTAVSRKPKSIADLRKIAQSLES